MPPDTVSVFKSFLVLTVIVVIGFYTAYHLLTLRNTNLDDEMTQEDSNYFKDGVLIDKMKGDKQEDPSKDPNYRKEVKREAPPSGTTTLMNDLDNSDGTNFMTDYNLDYSTTSSKGRVVTTTTNAATSSSAKNTESNESKGPTLPIGTVAMGTTTPMIPGTSTDKHPDKTESKSTSLEAPTGVSYAPSPAPSSPPTKWTSNKHLYTSPEIQKLAQEYFNSVTIRTTSEPAQKKGFSDTPSTSPTPARTGLDSTQTKETPKPTKPKYTSYKIPTTTTLPPPCFRQPYKISEVCTLEESHRVPRGENVTLEDIAKMVFLKSTLGSLKDKCEPGVWCIDQDMELQNIISEYLPFCNLKDCLLRMPDECLNEERRLVLSTLFLFCEANSENVTDTCMFAVRKMAHVTMTDIYRSKFRRNENTCRSLVEKNECNGTCLLNAQNLHCMHAVCNYSVKMFAEFDQWSWFFNLDDAESKCHLNNTDCTLFDMELIYESWWNKLMKMNHFLGSIHDLDVKVLVGMICAFMATMAGLAVLIWACIKRRTAMIYSRDKVEYAEIKDDVIDFQGGDEVIDFQDEWEIDDNTKLMKNVS